MYEEKQSSQLYTKSCNDLHFRLLFHITTLWLWLMIKKKEKQITETILT